MQLAADVLDRYDGGAWLVELAPVADPDQVPAAVAVGLGERDMSGDLLEIIVGRIGEQATLVLLDNCEHLLDSVACAHAHAAAALSQLDDRGNYP
jgi:predicted ATPase